MSKAGYDVVVVGAGPAGSIAAFVLATGGARVALVDKARPGRDKACGDLIGPRGVRVLADLGLDVGGEMTASDMIVAGPSGRQVLLPARAGHDYPGHAVVMTRKQFDALLRNAAIEAGAVDIVERAAAVDDGRVTLATGEVLDADFVIGADGATSVTARSAGLVDPSRLLWGFAVRGYVEEAVALPVIALWNDRPRRGFPGYGWLFPGPTGANLGLGVGLGHSRHHAERAQQQLDAFSRHLVRIGVLDSAQTSPVRQLGGWLKMGLVGTRPAEGRTLLVGDAAGLVNPLQGEGIAQALASGQAAARAVLDRPGDAARRYRGWVGAQYGAWTSVAAAVHATVVHRPRQIAALSAALTAPVLGSAIASTWAVYWNNLVEGAAPAPAVSAARAVHSVGRVVTTPSRLGRSLRRDLGDDTTPSRKSPSVGKT